MSEVGKGIKKLGFGFMRLPEKEGVVDLELTNRMVDRFMEAGYTYFDTAYVYGDGISENAIRDAVVKRYPREKFQLADKMPMGKVNASEDYETLFNTSLARTEAGYFDFYLLHALGKASFDKAEATGGFEFIAKKKEEGKIRHIGFSFHDSAAVLEEILSKHPEVEFVQLQLNYADWESENVQSRLCYECARRHDVNVIVMEPVKGGTLAKMSDEIESKMRAVHPQASTASWAMKFIGEKEGIITILSGMNSMEQMEDNICTLDDPQPLTEEENRVIAEVVEIFNSAPRIACTACKYCVDGCPMKINIPRLFSVMNSFATYGNLEGAKKSCAYATKESGKASECIQCGQCEGACPQHLPIIETLQKIAATLED
ncbi:MAG: aldo/keto reductase [Lachnospiraceae bacterium]|nr:aldo/keto reductase [Lachnospiraceae bacterium]